MNYKKLYKKLITILKNEKYLCGKFKPCCECERLKNEGMKEMLEWLFKDLIPEIEGKKHNMILFNKTEFKDWKEEIKK